MKIQINRTGKKERKLCFEFCRRAWAADPGRWAVAPAPPLRWRKGNKNVRQCCALYSTAAGEGSTASLHPAASSINLPPPLPLRCPPYTPNLASGKLCSSGTKGMHEDLQACGKRLDFRFLNTHHLTRGPSFLKHACVSHAVISRLLKPWLCPPKKHPFSFTATWS